MARTTDCSSVPTKGKGTDPDQATFGHFLGSLGIPRTSVQPMQAGQPTAVGLWRLRPANRVWNSPVLPGDQQMTHHVLSHLWHGQQAQFCWSKCSWNTDFRDAFWVNHERNCHRLFYGHQSRQLSSPTDPPTWRKEMYAWVIIPREQRNRRFGGIHNTLSIAKTVHTWRNNILFWSSPSVWFLMLSLCDYFNKSKWRNNGNLKLLRKEEEGLRIETSQMAVSWEDFHVQIINTWVAFWLFAFPLRHNINTLSRLDSCAVT